MQGREQWVYLTHEMTGQTRQGRTAISAYMHSGDLTKLNCGVEGLLMLLQDWNNRIAYAALSCT